MDPVIGGVRKALAEAARGQVDTAAAHAAEWLGAAPAKRDGSAEGTVAKLLIAEAMMQRGDSDVAVAYVADARRTHPCLVPPAGASAPLLRVATTLRAEGDCREYPPRAVLRAGLFLPGMGHFVQHRPEKAVIVGGLVTGALVSALSLHLEANRRYSDYQASTDYAVAPDLYAMAASRRSQARTRFMLGVGLWLTDAIVASVQAWAHNTEVSRDRF
jgi:hypothetical protein